MKNIIITLIFGVFYTISSQGQISDLAALSSGELRTFHAMWDKQQKFYGYLLVYNKGNINETEVEFEYVVLDKNLKQVLSKTIKADKIVERYNGYLNMKNELILYPLYVDNAKKQYSNTGVQNSWKIDLTTNSVTPYFGLCFENEVIEECQFDGTIKELIKEEKKEKKSLGYNVESNISILKEGGYVATKYEDYGNYFNNYTWIRFDENKKELWRTTMDEESNKKNSYIIRNLLIDSSHIYAFKIYTNYSTGEGTSLALLVLDTHTGKIVKQTAIDEFTDKKGISDDTNFSMLNLVGEGSGKLDSYKDFDDKIVFTGKIMASWKYTKGYYRMILDKKTLEMKYDHLFFHPDFNEKIDRITKDGRVGLYQFAIRDVFFLSDGSVIYIFEKYLDNGYSVRNDDLIFVFTDKDYKIKNVQIIDKEKSKNSATDYLFGQYLHDGKDFVFYFQDYKKGESKKDNKWLLYIYTWVNGELKNEEFPILTQENVIYPYVAKEGYILLREYNKNEKYNQIRLEKLNF